MCTLVITMGYQLELRHFQYFMAVAEELHFNKAAQKLFISQPGLSRQIKQMEEILGAQLFERNKRHVKLTTAGAYLQTEVSSILNHVDFIKKHTGLIAKGSIGEIRLGFLGSALQHIIPDLLLEMNAKFPAIKSTLEETSNHDQVKAILTDKLDVGFVRLESVSKAISIQPVFVDTFSLVLPANHPIGEDSFADMSQLSAENFILFSADYSSFYYHQIMSICEQTGFTPKVSHKSVHALTIFKLVENGLGVAIVPTTLQHGFDLNIKFIELKTIAQEAVLSVIWKKDNRNPVLRHVLDLLKVSDDTNKEI